MRRLRDLLANDSFHVFARASGIKSLTLAVNASLVLLLPSVIGADSYGDYAVLVSALALAVGVFRGPVEVLVQRSYQMTPSGFSTRYDLTTLRCLIVLTAFTGACLFLLTISLSDRRFSHLALLMLAVGAGVAVLSGLRRGRLMVSNRTDRVDILDLLLRPSTFIVSVLVVAATSGASGATMPYLLGASFVAVLTVPNLLALRADIQSTTGGAVVALRDWAKLAASSGVSALGKSADVLLLSAFGEGTAVGSYFILARMADLLAFGNSYANLRYTHRFAEAVRKGDTTARRGIVRSATRLSTAVAVSGAVPVLVLGPWLLPLVQSGLGAYYPAFAILVCAQVVNGLFGPRGAFVSSQWPGAALAIKSVNMALGLILLYAAVRFYGVFGAAGAMAVSIVMANLLSAVAFRSLTRSLSRDEARG